ncbi:MAG: methionyl-tRNA formyltransferase [Gluconacetobacter diazotrophicus]|nr:methionyl-tRNA formyltransferase [Gluconacetobacter diazotrophicus]
MRLAFMGTPDFAVPALRALHAAGHEIVAAYCQPPRPAGRGQAVRSQPVHAAAEALGIPVRTPARVKRDAEAHAAFRALELDAAVVAAYGLILPPAMLEAPRHGCLNIHASLLPRWRGAAPIQAAILHGDPETGITIMRMEEGLDTGPMLSREAVPIGPNTDAAVLHDALSALGARMIVRALDALPLGGERQDDALSCYAPRLERADGRLDWQEDAPVLDRRVRAMTPWPGAFAVLGEVALRIGAATPLPDRAHDALPGTVLDDALTVACGGGGALRIERLQWPGRAMLDAAAFLRGRPVPPGTRFG